MDENPILIDVRAVIEDAFDAASNKLRRLSDVMDCVKHRKLGSMETARALVNAALEYHAASYALAILTEVK